MECHNPLPTLQDVEWNSEFNELQPCITVDFDPFPDIQGLSPTVIGLESFLQNLVFEVGAVRH